MEFRVLGPVEAWVGAEQVALGPAQRRAVLAALLVDAGRPVPLATLIDRVWGQRPPAQPSRGIYVHIARLRSALGVTGASERVVRRAGGYLLDTDPDRVDLHRFRRLVGLARDAGRPAAERAELYGGALRLWRGPALADLSGDWVAGARLAWTQQRLDAVVARARLQLALGRADEVITPVRELLVDWPLSEPLVEVLMRALAASGRDAEALGCYAAIRGRLADQLGAEPGRELRALHTALLRGTLPPPRPPSASPPAPAVGPAAGDVRSPAAGSGRSPASGSGRGPAAGDVRGPASGSGRGPATTARPIAVPAPAGRSAAPAQLPGEVPGFTGRLAELAELDRLAGLGRSLGPGGAPVGAPVGGPGGAPGGGPVHRPGAVLIAAVAGTAGVGKTALALRWAHRAAADFPDGQLYVDLRGYDPGRPVAPGAALAGFLRALGVSGQDVPPPVAERAAAYRSLLAGRRALIVLDNASSAEQVRPLLPGAAGCLVVVTSRDSLPGLVARNGALRLDLDLLPPADAIALLRSVLGDRVTAEPAAARALAEQCARLPLALRVAAERALGRPGAPLADLVAELADHTRRLDRLDAGGDGQTAVRAVFSWSYRQLPPPAAALFRLLGLHPGRDLAAPAAAALAGTDPDHAGGLLDTLTRAHLVQLTGPGRYGMHDLLRAYAAELAAVEDPEPDRHAAVTRLLDHYLAAATEATAAASTGSLGPADQPRPVAAGALTPSAARAWLDAERANLVAVVGLAAGQGRVGSATGLATVLFGYLYLEGHHPDAVALHTHALAAARAGGDPAAEAHALTNLGAVYWRQGEHEQAADHYRRALARYRAAGGADRSGEARVLNNLALIHRRQGRYRLAATHHRRAIALYRAAGNRFGVASGLDNLGLVHRRQGNLEAAAEHHRQALTMWEAAGDGAGAASALDNLGLVDRQRGRYADAIEAHERALALFRAAGHGVGEAGALDNIGVAYGLLGRPGLAAERHREALARYRAAGHRFGAASALNGLATALRALGRRAESAELHAEALALAIRVGDRAERDRAEAGLAEAGLAEAGLAEDGRAGATG